MFLTNIHIVQRSGRASFISPRRIEVHLALPTSWKHACACKLHTCGGRILTVMLTYPLDLKLMQKNIRFVPMPDMNMIPSTTQRQLPRVVAMLRIMLIFTRGPIKTMRNSYRAERQVLSRRVSPNVLGHHVKVAPRILLIKLHNESPRKRYGLLASESLSECRSPRLIGRLA